MTQPFELPPLPEPQLSHVENWGDSSEVMGEYEAKDYARAYARLCVDEALEAAAKVNLTLDEWRRVADILNNYEDRGPRGEGYQSDELSKLSAKVTAAVDAMKAG
jgi:hypothetical protein